jgi:hypothetical protein
MNIAILGATSQIARGLMFFCSIGKSKEGFIFVSQAVGNNS